MSEPFVLAGTALCVTFCTLKANDIERLDKQIAAFQRDHHAIHSPFLTPIAQQLPAVAMVIFPRSSVTVIKTNRSARLAAASYRNPMLSPGTDQLYELMNKPI